MLSFLQKQLSEDSSNCGGSVQSDDSEQPQEQEYLIVADHKKQVRKSSITLGALFGVGFLCFVFMLTRNSPKSASAAAAESDQMQLEIAIAKLGGASSEIFSGVEKMINKFHEFSKVRQVDAGELIKNPFKIDRSLYEPEEIEDTLAQHQSSAADMRLFSIMSTQAGNCCMIDDKLLYKGDSIKGFKVVEIGGNFVRIEKEGAETTLKLVIQ